MLGLGLGLTLENKLGSTPSAPAGYVQFLGRQADGSYAGLQGVAPYRGVIALYGKVA